MAPKTEANMSKAFDKVMDGLTDVDSYLNGARTDFEVHTIEVPEPNVAAIRSKTGLSQPAFAKSIGVALGTLKNWEQGRRRPEGAARVLLALIEKRPSSWKNSAAERRPEKMRIAAGTG